MGAKQIKKTPEEANKVDEKDALKVFVRGLPWSIDEASLQKHFAKCGGVEECLMPKTPAGKSRGVGFLKFMTRDGMNNALKFDNTECNGRTINVSRVEKREAKGGGKNGKP